MASSNSQGPTPWWQLPENAGKLNNLNNSAPAGYQYDPVQMRYAPQINSPSDQLAQRSRTQGIQDTALSSILTGLNAAGSGGGTGSGSGSGSGVGRVPGASAPPPIQSPFGASFPGAISGIGSGSGNPATVSGQSTVAPMNMPAHVSAASGPTADQRQASDDATYATAKDSAANTMQAAMRGLTGEMASRGMGGAGYEAGRIGENVVEGANTIGQASRQHAQQQYDAAQQLQSEELQADVAQRGQDLGAMTTGRGQDIGAQEAQNAGLITQRGQDIGNANTTRGQDLSAAEANMSGQLAQRGQDIGLSTANMGNATTQRGQDVQAQIAQSNITAQKQQSLLNLALGGLTRVSPSLSY